MKKILLCLIILLSSVRSVGAATDNIATTSGQMNATVSATLTAELLVNVTNPPAAPVLLGPPSGAKLCDRSPLFYWEESSEDIATYSFHLSGLTAAGKAFVIDYPLDIGENVTTSDYQVKFANGIVYFRLQFDIPWGNYTWTVTARNHRNEATSTSYNLDFAADQCQCSASQILPQTNLLTLTQTIYNRRPPITINYSAAGAPKYLSVFVNDVPYISQVLLDNSQVNDQFILNINRGLRTIILQPKFDYLPVQTDEYQLEVVLLDEAGCSRSYFRTFTFGSGTGSSISDKLLTPFFDVDLIGPEMLAVLGQPLYNAAVFTADPWNGFWLYLIWLGLMWWGVISLFWTRDLQPHRSFISKLLNLMSWLWWVALFLALAFVYWYPVWFSFFLVFIYLAVIIKKLATKNEPVRRPSAPLKKKKRAPSSVKKRSRS